MKVAKANTHGSTFGNKTQYIKQLIERWIQKQGIKLEDEVITQELVEYWVGKAEM